MIVCFSSAEKQNGQGDLYLFRGTLFKVDSWLHACLVSLVL